MRDTVAVSDFKVNMGKHECSGKRQMSRKYELKRRAERQEETQRRIVDATVALHAEIGPARTTIKAIAKRAGVERLTVYRHFPDEAALFGACGARFRELHPPPNPGEWAEIAEPVERLRRALSELYAYYSENQSMLLHSARDAEHLPALRTARAPFGQYLLAVRSILATGWDTSPGSRSLDAALGHAIELTTWQSLVQRQGLPESEAVELVVRFVESAVAGGDL
jgi:AcrR family transcriptional regulator